MPDTRSPKKQNLDHLFHPRSIAIVGISDNANSMGRAFLTNILNLGYRGQVYPVSDSSAEVMGIKAYHNLKQIPGSVDYVISCVAAGKTMDLVSECEEKRVKFIHFFTARFAETGDKSAAELEKKIRERVRGFGARMIGPNSMGVYCPRGGMSFDPGSHREPGKLGMFCQSGGNAAEVINYGGLRGVRFSKVISYGNAIDLNEVDLLEYLTEDDETEIIAGYVEGVKDGKAFFNALKCATARKPVIILKGGRGSAGAMAAASHTAAMAGSHKIWQVAMRQSGAIQARSMEDLINLIVAFYFLPPVTGTNVGLAGRGGGRAVRSADEWEEAGFTLPPLPEEMQKRIRSALPELWWDWVKNPLDFSIIPSKGESNHLVMDLVRMMAESPAFDLISVSIAPGSPYSKSAIMERANREVSEIIDIAKVTGKPMVIVLNTGDLHTGELEDITWAGVARLNTRFIEAGIPVYLNSSGAGSTIYRMVHYYRRKLRA